MWSGPGTTRHIIPWTVMTGSNIPPASMSQPQELLGSQGNVFPALERAQLPAGAPGRRWMPTSFSVKAIGRRPRGGRG